MAGYGLIEQLTSVIRLIMDYPQGLSILMGTVPPPSGADICGLLETVRPPSGPVLDRHGFPLRPGGGPDFVPEADRMIDSAERFNRIIARAGGWGHINYVVRDWAKIYLKAWGVVVDHVRWAKSRIDSVTVGTLADAHELSRNTVYRIIQNFPQELATAVINTPINGELQLSGDVRQEAV